jgi:hypothetical protein
MRRVSAILLVFLFSFSLAGPALLQDGQSNLPACCRRDGKHHCGMTDRDMADSAQTPSSGPAVEALRTKCPFFPNGGAVVPESGPALLAASQADGVSIVSQAANPAQSQAGYRISFNTSHRKRGPPSLLS